MNCTLSKNKLIRMERSRAGVMTILDERISGVSVVNRKTLRVYLKNVTVEYSLANVFNYHGMDWGSAALYVRGLLESFYIIDSTFQYNHIAAIQAFRSHLTFQGMNTIVNNVGITGGGILLCESSTIIVYPNTTINISGNHAYLTGGGIYVEDNCPGSTQLCFYQIQGANTCGGYRNISRLGQECNISITMSHNTAGVAGSQIWEQCSQLLYPLCISSAKISTIYSDFSRRKAFK